MKKILLPTDFSKNAWNAIGYAMGFLKDEECMFYLLNTYTPVIYRVDYLIGGPAVSAVPDIGIDVSLAGLERSVERIKKEHPNPKHRFKIISEFNTLTDEVLKVCGEEGIDLIIMGTKGATGAKEIFLGSNAIHVIRKTRVPILVIPEGFVYKPLEAVLFPTDYLVQYNPENMALLFEIMEKSDALLHIVHAEAEKLAIAQMENKEQLKKMVNHMPSLFEDITDGYMPNIVHAYVEKHNIDLVVMMNKRHSFLRRLLFRQNIDQVGYHCAVPFLVLPDTS